MKNDLLDKTSLCVCSYLKSLKSRRASLVHDAMRSWNNLLELPFAEKIFVDDRSPEINGIRMLELSKSLDKFDEVNYNTLIHPPHSNFGILASLEFCKSEYLLHIDDDIVVTGSTQECLSFLEKCLRVLEKDKSILGINILNMPKEFDQDWFPGKDYSGSNDFAHPNRYFGNAASLIRRELLEKVSLTDIINWGAEQPNTWERLVSDDVLSFLVAKIPSPFGLNIDAWVVQSTSDTVSWEILKYDLKKNFPVVNNLASALKDSLRRQK